jgi:hypothetical protein
MFKVNGTHQTVSFTAKELGTYYYDFDPIVNYFNKKSKNVNVQVFFNNQQAAEVFAKLDMDPIDYV